MFSGSYAKWDNNIIANHNVLIDTARGRQGSPLLPTFYNFAAIADATAGIGGTDGDYMANFRGVSVRIPGGGGETFAADSGTYHILGIDAATGEYKLYSYEASAATVNNTGALTDAGFGTKTGDSFAEGSLFVQANEIGTPIGYALAMGKDAMYFAKGKLYGEQIFHYDDFANSGNEAHLSAVGVQSVYGMAARKDTRGRVPAVQLIEVVRQVPGLSLAQ